ncbi:FAD-binding oxidoreductase [Rothia sp. AR01]|uniref:FAD-binding oxidoreductase n=1 Tax=Rothia santali TaxID=2949643 RepID=A0A9X2HM95_9MICC|nr:FAD-dependent oxidoreductase [Rothia santali]MCP3426943.1 FAD-binding oxidoreductase [Rothia santali]
MRVRTVLDKADIVIVGAGISGVTTAYELRKRGFDVIIVEQRFPAYGASGRNAGALWIQTCSAGTELDLALAGRDKYSQYVDELGNTFDFRQNGGLFFFETEGQGRLLESYVRDRRAAGLEAEIMDLNAAKEMSPLLPDTAIGAVYCADDAQVDSPRFVKAVSDACVRMGVRMYENTSVLSTIRDGDSVIGVRTVRGEIHASGLVWATGAWAVNLEAEGIEVPVTTARQGQLVTQPLEPTPSPIMRGPRGVLRCTALTSLSNYEARLFEHHDGSQSQPDEGRRIRYDDTITQNGAGSLFVGSSIDSYGALNPHIGLAATNAMVSMTLDRFSRFASIGITGLWAGVSSWAEDQLPIIGRADGVYLNVGHSYGVSSGPIGGQIMADAISAEPNKFSDELRPGRDGSVR